MDERVKIALINIFEARNGGHISEDLFDQFASTLRTALEPGLKPDEQFERLMSVVFAERADRQFRNQAGPVSVDRHFASLKTASGLRSMLKKIARLPRTNRSVTLSSDEVAAIDEARWGDPDDYQCRLVAKLINRHAKVGELMIGLPHGIFWLTPFAEAAKALSKTPRPGERGHRGRIEASTLRDLLGLIHIGKEPIFAFRSTHSLIRGGGISGLRPTGLDGADNARFCQNEARLGVTRPNDWGVATHMKDVNVFGPGLSEAIAQDMSIAGNLRCIYLGRVSTPPPGSHPAYRALLLGSTPFDAVRQALGV